MATNLVIRRVTTSIVAMLMSRLMPARTDARLDVEARLMSLEAKEEIRSLMTMLACLVDSGLLSGLSTLEPRLHAGFTLRVVDLAGAEKRYVGLEGMIDVYAPIMASGRAKLIASAIAVEVDGDRATAHFKLAGSVSSSPELGLPVGRTILLISAHNATLRREGGIWRLSSLDLAHAMVDGTPPAGRAKAKAAKKPISRGKRASQS